MRIFFACLAAWLLLFANLVSASVLGEISGRFRSFYFNRTYIPLQESMAVGGWLQYESPTWQGIKLTLAGYTSQGLFFTDPAHGGGGVLGPSQESFSVLGIANLNAKLANSQITLFRQSLNTPFINQHDVRMLPKLVEAYTFSSQLTPSVYFLASQVTKIKGWANNTFIPMSDFAGYRGTDKGVTLAGMILNPGSQLKLQGWNYYCYDFMNVVYLHLDSELYRNTKLNVHGQVQSLLQNSIGQAMGGNFSTGMFGLKGICQLNSGINLVLAYTNANKNHDIENPWGAYPGFTSIIGEDCDLAGEHAWTVGIENNLCQVGSGNLATKLYHTEAYILGNGSIASPHQYETDLLFEYRLATNYYWQLRGILVNHALDMSGTNYSSCRFNVNYDF